MPVVYFTQPLLPSPPRSWLFSLFLFLFFLADLVSLVFLFLLSVDVCLACVYFSIVIFLWVLFSFAFFFIFFFLQASFVLPGAVSPLHIDVNTDCWFWTLLGKGRGGRGARTALKGPGERMLGGWSGPLCDYPYFAGTHFSSWPEVWHFFPRVLRVLGSAWLPSLPPSHSLYPAALELSFPLFDFLLSLKHIWRIMFFSTVEHPLGGGRCKGSALYWQQQ